MVGENFGNWIAGFTAGEGHFGFQVRKTGGSDKFRPRFSIALRNDDSSVLFEIANTLGCGYVRTNEKASKGIVSGHPTAIYLCDDIASLHNIIVPLFERYPLRAKKARDFTIWKEAISLMFLITRRRKINSRWGWIPRYTKEEKVLLRLYAQRLREVRVYNYAEELVVPAKSPESRQLVLEHLEEDVK